VLAGAFCSAAHRHEVTGARRDCPEPDCRRRYGAVSRRSRGRAAEIYGFSFEH